MNFKVVKVTLQNSVLSTDLPFKPTDTPKFYFTLFYLILIIVKKDILFSQKLRLNRICFDNSYLRSNVKSYNGNDKETDFTDS